MPTYVSKTHTVDAMQWNCANYAEISAYLDGNVALTADNTCLIVNSQRVCNGDWVLRFSGVEITGGPTKYKFSTMSDETFRQTYDV